MEKQEITTEQIDKLAELSMLTFSESEKQKMKAEVSGIIEMLNGCNEVETSKIDITNSVGLGELREDEIIPGLPREVAMTNVPKKRKGYYSVPKVLK